MKSLVISHKVVEAVTNPHKNIKSKYPILFSVYYNDSNQFICHTTDLDTAFKMQKIITKKGKACYVTYGIDHRDYDKYENTQVRISDF